MTDMLFILVAFAIGYLCGLFTKHEIWVWVKKHGKTAKKK